MQSPVLILGATGYVGHLLRERLERDGVPVRCATRHPDRFEAETADTTEVMRGDMLDPETLPLLLEGVETVYYLVHLMQTDDFEEQDRQAAQNLRRAAENADVRRVIYLGGLGNEEDKLSHHLRSRQEVGQILRDSSSFETIEFRAAVVLGRGSLSFDLVRALTDRLPIMLCPRWVRTPTQPIAIDDVLRYLLAARDLELTGSRVIEIGGADVVGYDELIREYARQTGKKRYLIPVPVLTPKISGLWLRIVTPEQAQVAKHLIEGLRNPTVVRDHSATEIFDIKPIGIREAIRIGLGLDEENESKDG